jgi:glycosyltransferase involved in cell wall biosynthesis
MENKRVPLLSVCMITYNHALFIRQAIESVLMQQVNFDWEFINADDFSTDGTRDILVEYQQKFPSRIKLLLQEKNVGAAQNWFDLLDAPIGKYIAYFEGDDYWTDPLKLQKQVDYLEANPHLSFCFHRIREENPDGSIVDAPLPPHHNGNIFSIEDLARYNFVHTPSVLFRREFMGTIPDYFTQISVGDYPLWMLLASKGDFGYINEKMAVYRRGFGIWSGQDRVQMLIKWSALLTELEKVYINKEVVVQNLVEQHLTIISELFEKLSGRDFSLLSKEVSFSQQMYSIESLIVELKQNDLRSLGIKHIVKQLLIKIKARIFKT